MLSKVKPAANEFMKPLALKLVRSGIKPNHLSFVGLSTGLLAAYAVLVENFAVAAVLLLLSGFFDALDGAVARFGGMVTEFGGFLDSVLDRYVDIAVFLALAAKVDWLLSTVAMAGALMVSYTRARAEKFLPRCDVGIAERGERMILIAIGLPTNAYAAIAVVAVLSHVTALQRIVYTFRQSKAADR
ncbi:MAG: archaetidylinositol phosphate synthase [Archaeoglobaceae archaeon]